LIRDIVCGIFFWILGTGLACAFAILNAIWLEFRIDDANKDA